MAERTTSENKDHPFLTAPKHVIGEYIKMVMHVAQYCSQGQIVLLFWNFNHFPAILTISLETFVENGWKKVKICHLMFI